MSKPARRFPSTQTIDKRQAQKERAAHLEAALREYNYYYERAEEQAQIRLERETRYKRNLFMTDVLATIQATTKTAVMKAMDISAPTLDRWIKQYEEEKGKP